MKKILKMTGFAFLAGIGLIILLYIGAFLSGKPEIGKNYSLELYDNQDKLFYASVNEKSGEWVSLDEVNEDFLHAIIDIEDKYFYYHQGFDPIGIMRAAISNLKAGEITQGASTISMQYVKNLFLTNDKTWERKLKETWLTMQIETHYSKEEILEGYINTVYFGAGIYGVQNAAQYFFSKDAKNLNLHEASILAGMINGPELYSPTRNPDLVKERQKLVLDAMYQNQHISEKEHTRTSSLPISLKLNQNKNHNQTLGYFKDAVIEELASLGFDENDCLKNGLKVYTTLDTKTQQAVSQSISQTFKEDEKAQTAVVIIEPNSGALLALAGGKDYSASQYNRATMAERQMASTVKPILYYDALANGFNPATKFVSEKTTFRLSNDELYAPTNYNDLYANKEITMLDAIATSDNIYAVKTHLFLGENTLSNRLKMFGYDNATAIPSLALGCVETSPLKLANMYNCLASLGEYYDDYCIERIEDQNGKVLYQHQIKSKQILDEDICLVLNQLLTSSFDEKLDDVLSPTMLNYKTDTTYAAKTGTSDWDSWTVAYNPQAVIAIWVGFDENEPLDNTYKYHSRNIFKEIATHINQEQKAEWYKPSKNIVQIPIDPLTGNPAFNGSVYWFYQPSKPTKSKREVI